MLPLPSRPHDHLWLSGSIVLCFLLAACATPQRNAARDQVRPPEQWAAGTTVGPVEDEWWRQFGNAQLAACVNEALARNHDLRAAAARLDAAMAEARVAGADLYPRLDFGFDARRQQNVFVGLPIPGASQPLKSLSTSYGADFNVSWELDVWGRVRAGRRAALAGARASASDLAGARNSLIAQTAKAWSAVVESHRQLGLARATAENYSTVASQVRARYERGIREPLDLRLALANTATARALAAQREAQLQSAKRQLEILLGRHPAGQFSETNDLPKLAEDVPAGLPGELLDRRPDLVAAEERLAAAAARAWEAKAALFPRIALTASGGRTSSELEDLLDSDFNVWTVAGNFVQPLFQGGKLRANVKLNEARTREAVENYLSTVLRAFGEVETALADEQLLARREEDLAEAARQSAAAQRLAEDRYRSGLTEFITVLEAQRRALDSESQLIAVRRARFDRRVDLHLALGGGFGAGAQFAGSQTRAR